VQKKTISYSRAPNSSGLHMEMHHCFLMDRPHLHLGRLLELDMVTSYHTMSWNYTVYAV
jgi:hypothetical protein